MEFALGVLHWTPETFWKSTISEILIASDGHRAFNTVEDEEDELFTFEEFESLSLKLDGKLP